MTTLLPLSLSATSYRTKTFSLVSSSVLIWNDCLSICIYWKLNQTSFISYHYRGIAETGFRSAPWLLLYRASTHVHTYEINRPMQRTTLQTSGLERTHLSSSSVTYYLVARRPVTGLYVFSSTQTVTLLEP